MTQGIQQWMNMTLLISFSNVKPGGLRTNLTCQLLREIYPLGWLIQKPELESSKFLSRPIIDSGLLQWRLRDAKELIQFLHGVNDKIKEDQITSTISICTLDIKNMFPSIFKNLALPAIKVELEKKVILLERSLQFLMLLLLSGMEGVQWNGEVIKQVDGCSLGPADSCDY